MIEPVEIEPGTWVIQVPLPIPSPPFTNCYVIADSEGRVHLVDPGWDFGSTRDDLDAELRAIGFSLAEVASVTVSHMHVDHLGLAQRIRDEAGAVIAMHAVEQAELDALASQGPDLPNLEEWGIPVSVRAELSAAVQGRVYPALTADVLLQGGELLDVPGRTIRVLSTPGHTAGSISLHDEESGLLFTGDTLLPQIFPGIGLGGQVANPIADYLVSLDRLESLGEVTVLPGHGEPFSDLAARCDETRAHQLGRTAEVERIIRAEPTATVWDVASQVTWTDGFANLHGVHLASALAQTAMRMAYFH